MKIGLGIGIPFIRNYISSLFDPSKLFTGSTNGVWYDPSDINLTWRRNLLTYSEQFDNAAWAKINAGVSITANASIAPDGTVTADKLVGTNAASSKEMYNSTAVPTAVGSTYTASVYAKVAEYSWIYIVCNVNGTLDGTFFNLATGEIGNTIGAGSIPSITSAGNGWYRVSSTRSATVTSGYIEIFPVTANGTGPPSYTGDGTSGIYIWGAQLEQGSTATPYQRITDGIQDYLQYQAQPVLYRDAAGTTPVTGVEQPVGLMLDKSKGLVLGPELVTNGAFDTNVTGWIAMQNATISWSGGRGRATGDGVNTYPGIQQAVTTIIGRTYRVEGNVYAISGGPSTILQASTSFGAGPGQGDVTSTGTYKTFVFTAAATTTYIKAVANSSANAVIECDNISVRELSGNHAFNSSGNSANFPVLSARYNLLTKTEQFNDAYWTKSGITLESSTVTAPDGTATATRFSNTATTSIHRLASDAFTLGLNKMKLWAKPGTAAFISINSAATAFQAIFDLSSGVVSSESGCIATILPANNGFYELTLVPTTGSSQFFCVNFATTSGNAAAGASFLGAGETMTLWHPDLRVANDALNQPAYQRVNTSTDYDTVGFKPYLRFNGTNQWLQTNSIDFTYGDKMFVSAGVRKLSDAAAAIFVELSADWNSNNGSFLFTIPDSTGSAGNYGSASRGTATANVNQVALSATTLAPVTNVISVAHNISGNLSSLRLNGAANGTNGTGSKGIGNFSNRPLYIGARAGASFWFDGRLYSLIVAGKLANAVEITETEKYVNGKTAAY